MKASQRLKAVTEALYPHICDLLASRVCSGGLIILLDLLEEEEGDAAQGLKSPQRCTKALYCRISDLITAFEGLKGECVPHCLTLTG